MKNWIIIFGFIISSFLKSSAQNDFLKIDYLPDNPKIDGILDNELEKLPVRKLHYYNTYNFTSKSFSITNDYREVEYRIGYNLHTFYVYIEADLDSIYYCNKNSWKGDFMQVILTQPNTENLANYFYGLYFTANEDTAERFYMNYNRFESEWNYGKNTKFATNNHNGKLGYEAIIDWNDINPYHPFLMDNIGFNLLFSKITNDSTMVDYFVEPSEHMNGGNGMSVKYINVEFEKPKKSKEIYNSYACHTSYFENKPIIIDRISSLANNMNDTITINIKDDNDSIVFATKLCSYIQKNITKSSVEINPGLKKGNYTLEIESKLKLVINNHKFSVIPKVDFEKIYPQILNKASHFNERTVNSMTFRFMELKKIIENCTNYTPVFGLNGEIENFFSIYNQYINEVNPFEQSGTTQRRAYISSIDKSYQPYSIRLPNNYDKSKKYPLLVFLHGSGGDETQLDYLKSNYKYIEMSPNGRDKNKCYTTIVSQMDILESISDVINSYSVDTTNIIIGGLSMGGYGALLTCYNSPDEFKGIFLYSSITYASMVASYESYPDFTKTKYLNNFKDKPIYIHHGKQDYNAPYNLTEKMKMELDNVEANVTFISIDDLGHGMYGDVKYYKSFFEWLEKITN